jgi:hypothetical protein
MCYGHDFEVHIHHNNISSCHMAHYITSLIADTYNIIISYGGCSPIAIYKIISYVRHGGCCPHREQHFGVDHLGSSSPQRCFGSRVREKLLDLWAFGEELRDKFVQDYWEGWEVREVIGDWIIESWGLILLVRENLVKVECVELMDRELNNEL